jgi:GT2 family glycosyltransferase/glycosyltransferase involved in cell wall biosynthesis
MSMNSRDYWDARFRTDWDALGGAEQSRFFAKLAVDAMPEWFRTRLTDAHLTFCDWGCAEGAGTELLAAALKVPTTGIDFSAEAIAIAKSRHPQVAFLAADILTAPIAERFDVVFSSNTLEHFRDPWQAFAAIAGIATRYVALLLPYRELVRHPEHFVSFTPSDLPAARDGFVLVHAAAIDAAHMPDSAWPGEQVLCIYARPEEIEAVGVALSQLRLDTPAFEAVQAQAHANADAVRELGDRLRAEADRAGVAQQAIDRLTTAVLDMQARIVDAITHDIARVQQEHARLMGEAGQLQAAHAAQQVELNAAHAQRATLAAERNALVDALAAQARDLAALQSQHDALQATHAQLATDRAALESQYAGLDHAHRTLERRLPKLELDAADLARIRGSLLWRGSAPLRLVKRVLTGRTTPAQAWRSMLAFGARLPVGDAAKRRLVLAARSDAFEPVDAHVSEIAAQVLRPAPASAGKPDVFVWAVIDWHFRIQRPQHLARALAERGHRVFYISNNLVDSAEPGFGLEALDTDARLFQVHLHVRGAPGIYYAMPDAAQAQDLQASLGKLVAWAGTTASMSFVQHPFWSDLATLPPNVRRVYDCMDHHAGFEDNAPALIAAERALVERSDLVVVTSSWLEREIGAHARQVAVVRNAGEYDFFAQAPRKVFRDPDGRQVIGYYGAIAAWFDIDLVERVARAFPDALVLLIGADTAGAGERLAALPNVRFEGEVPYADLPYWLHGFDVCLLPFRVIELTLATNPVKVYEYLSAGKPVVGVDLPEMAQFEGLVHVAADADGFVEGVREALAAPPSDAQRAARQAFAAQQTWDHRATALDAAVDAIVEPRVSLVVLAYNNLDLTKACLSSIALYSDYPNLEVIVVDNASSDGTPAFLRAWETETPPPGQTRRVLLNDRNLGFAAGNNVGLAAATGEYLVLLNNDTYVTPGWVRTLVAHLRRDRSVGLVGPVTNNIGNEARIEIAYADMPEMIRLAGERTRDHAGRAFPIATAAFFCVAFPREVYERVGGLDEAFGMGFFEDDDYCRRLAQAGWRVVCAEDVFVHHHLSATFAKLPSAERQALFERNKAIYEAKWGAWEPHRYR